MCAAQASLRRPSTNRSIAGQWSTYPRNVASLFKREDLEDYNNFFAINRQRLFHPDKIQLAFWTARDHADQAVNGKIDHNLNGEPDKAGNSESKPLAKQRSVISENVTDTLGFDAVLEVSASRAGRSLTIALS